MLAVGGAIAAQEAVRLPALEPGAAISVAITQGAVEYEGLRTIEAADDTGIRIGFTWSAPDDDGTEILGASSRFVRREDLDSANRIVAAFHRADPESFPGSTAIQTSEMVLQQLKNGAEVPIVFGIALGWQPSPLATRKYYRGSLRSVGLTPFPLLLNGRRVTVDALHAGGTLALAGTSAEAEFWWLDDIRNPLTLRWRFAGDQVQTVRIDFPERRENAASGSMAATLGGDACRAELHGVYFDSGSATLIPASHAALERVAALLAEHPDWRITIEGHTDSVGDDAANQALSERRAAAVLAALSGRFEAAAQNLSAQGFGETRPVESNDTLEGRAHNRRVELARDCTAQ